jgi:hypothetical protein
MQDDFTPVRYDLHHASGEGLIQPDDQGLYVGYTDFLTARHSRDHWKGKASRWEAEAKQQEACIQNVEKLLCDAYKECEALRADVKRLTSIIDHNTDDKGRDLRQANEDIVRLVTMLADINAISFRAISK